MDSTQIVNCLVRIAEAEDPEAIHLMDSLVESYLAENRGVPPADLLRPIFFGISEKNEPPF
jgi:hypothetical protein